MANETFKAGDVVQLKSGSPKMTIEYIYNDGRCFCSWYDSYTHTLHREISFQPASLMIVNDKSGVSFA
jgi:uncharacterized protein YodC (DUF2158 family)